MVLPHFKKANYGYQKAKNVLWDLWDEFRGFGLEKHIAFTPSNESFFPSSIYGAFGYSLDSLRDSVFKYGMYAQGLTSRNVYDTLLEGLGLTTADDIPSKLEDTIFPHLTVAARDPEFWRLIVKQDIFYSSSYYYFDEEDTRKEDLFKMFKDQLSHYITKSSAGHYGGHLIKVFIPSSYHTKTISQALPYPVKFEMKKPLLLAIRIKTELTTGELQQHPAGPKVRVLLTPSVYSSTVYINEIMNLGDCKKVGVYHVQTTEASYPVIMNLYLQTSSDFTWSYQFPPLPKHVFSYRSEAGTYAGKSHLTPLPPAAERRPIKTLPSQFVEPISWDFPGLPRFVGQIKSEDIQYGMKTLPRNAEEASLQFVQRYFNAGWRRKSIKIDRVPDSDWTLNSEVKFHLNISRDYVSPQEKEPETDWSKDLKFDDKLDEEDTSAYIKEGELIHRILSTSLNHIKDSVVVKAEHISGSKVLKKADFNVDYRHTPEGFLHLFHFNASAEIPKIITPLAITVDYAIGFIEKPNEFKYGQYYGKQKGLALGSISFCKTTPFQSPSIVAKAVFKYKPLNQVLKMDSPVKPSDYEPETHLECLDDVKEGKSHSAACVKAIREKSIYNHLKMHASWLEDSPSYIKEIGEKFDLALKHAFYSHLYITKKDIHSKSLRIEGTYIDKMTDEPVVDVVLDKPSETVRFSRVSTGKFQPISSVESLVESYAAALSNNSYPATCVMMDKFIRTYDMMTYEMPYRGTPACTYVLSTHCTENKKFAILVKHDYRVKGTQEIHFYVGSDLIILVQGSENTYKVKYNEEEKTVRPLAPLMLSESALITALVDTLNDGSSFIEINAQKAGVMVRYDGTHVKVQVHPRYKGELCGLCSDFNGEIIREFKGVDRCLYTDELNFFKSAAIDSCVSVVVNKQNYMCDNGHIHRSPDKDQEQDETDMWRQTSDEPEGQEPITRRNVVLSQGSKVCFSTQPVPVCENSVEPISTESRQVDFHCLPKQDINARKMVTESKRRILAELETKPVDHIKIIEVAKMC